MPPAITLLGAGFIIPVLAAYRLAPWISASLIPIPVRRLGIGRAVLGVIGIVIIAASHVPPA